MCKIKKKTMKFFSEVLRTAFIIKIQLFFSFDFAMFYGYESNEFQEKFSYLKQLGILLINRALGMHMKFTKIGFC